MDESVGAQDRSTVGVVTASRAAAARPHPDITPLMLASRAVAAAMVRSLESVDASVSVTQMRVLVLLWTGEPLNLSAVAEGLGVNASNASRTCDRLVAAGLVDRGEDPVDRRQVSLTLTSRGRAFVERLMTRREHELATIVARMSEADRQRLMSALEPFNRAAESDLWPSERSPGARDPRLLEWGI
jgi:DNA-binding MarR family transcriptional regulator